MAAKIIKELHGFSGNQIFLMDKHGKLFVRKIGTISRNVERLTALYKKFPVPKIFNSTADRIDMEYIHGLDIKSFLISHHYENLLQFLIKTLDNFSKTTNLKNYTNVYHTKLEEISFEMFPFTKEELIARLPAELPCSNYHGDLTLENIIYTEDRGFFLIDAATIEYDSYIFDIAKLRQDLECKWFLRSSSAMLDNKLKNIQTQIFLRYPNANNDYLLILMLLRVYKHAKANTLEQDFLIREITKLWK